MAQMCQRPGVLDAAPFGGRGPGGAGGAGSAFRSPRAMRCCCCEARAELSQGILEVETQRLPEMKLNSLQLLD